MYLIIKSVWVNGSSCLISYVNVVALLNIIQNELIVTFVSLRVFVYPSIQAVNAHCWFADSYGPSMLSLSESKLGSLQCSWVSWNAAECLGMQPSATKSIIVICANAYMNTVFIHGIITWTSFAWQPQFAMPSWSTKLSNDIFNIIEVSRYNVW
jgi:hypothetical protein